MLEEKKHRKPAVIKGEKSYTRARLKAASEILSELCQKYNGYVPLPYLIGALVEKLGISRSTAYIYANTVIQTAGYKTMGVDPVYIILCS